MIVLICLQPQWICFENIREQKHEHYSQQKQYQDLIL